MKKCYIVPVSQSLEVEIASFLNDSPFNDGSNQISKPTEYTEDSEDVDARQRGGDFGTLW